MSHQNKTSKLNLFLRFIFPIIALSFALTSHAQTVKNSEDWWTPIIKKHNIKFDSYTLHGDHFIIGDKINVGDMEIFKNVTVIPKSSDGYWIVKSETASYDSKTTILKINDCTMEKFIEDSNSLVPIESYDHTDLIINIENNSAEGSYFVPDDNKK